MLGIRGATRRGDKAGRAFSLQDSKVSPLKQAADILVKTSDLKDVANVIYACAEKTFSSTNYSATDLWRSGYPPVIRYVPSERWWMKR